MYDNEGNMVPDAPLYVCATDSFLSGWGHSQGLKNRLIFPCYSGEEVDIVEDNCLSRSDMKHVTICTSKPRLSKQKYYAQVKTIDDYPRFYEAGYFG